MDMINPGALRDSIEFYSLERVKDEGGGTDAELVFEFSALAKLTKMRGMSKIEGGKLINIQAYKVTFRANPDYNPTVDMRVKFRGQEYSINDIDPIDVYQGFWNLIIVKE